MLKKGQAIRDPLGAWWVVAKVKRRKVELRINGSRGFVFRRDEIEAWTEETA